MRTAIFIEALVTKDVPILSGEQVCYERMNPELCARMPDTNEYVPVEMLRDSTSETVFVPVHRICKSLGHGAYSDTYFAYSEEFEEMVGLPFRLIVEEKDSLKGQINTLNATLNGLQGAIEIYHKQPWYKRVWQAYQGRIL